MDVQAQPWSLPQSDKGERQVASLAVILGREQESMVGCEATKVSSADPASICSTPSAGQRGPGLGIPQKTRQTSPGL